VSQGKKPFKKSSTLLNKTASKRSAKTLKPQNPNTSNKATPSCKKKSSQDSLSAESGHPERALK
jgi:hypothetical protein